MPAPSETETRWWRIPVFWLAIGGPAVVVVAGIATAVIAVRGADEPLATGRVIKAVPMAPAGQARNHVVTP
jgi:hypothetical protein